MFTVYTLYLDSTSWFSCYLGLFCHLLLRKYAVEIGRDVAFYSVGRKANAKAENEERIAVTWNVYQHHTCNTIGEIRFCQNGLQIFASTSTFPWIVSTQSKLSLLFHLEFCLSWHDVPLQELQVSATKPAQLWTFPKSNNHDKHLIASNSV